MKSWRRRSTLASTSLILLTPIRSANRKRSLATISKPQVSAIRSCLATKYRSQVGDGVNDIGASRYHIVRTVEASLKRLKTDRIDLLYCHSWDAETPIEETLRAVDDLIHQGKVLYAGASNFPTWVLASALWTSDMRNLYRIEAIQSVFNILQPGLAVEMIRFARKHGIAVVPYSPLASGFLTRQTQRFIRHRLEIRRTGRFARRRVEASLRR